MRHLGATPPDEGSQGSPWREGQGREWAREGGSARLHASVPIPVPRRPSNSGSRGGGGSFAPRGHLVTCGDTVGCLLSGVLLASCGREARDAATHPATHRAGFHREWPGPAIVTAQSRTAAPQTQAKKGALAWRALGTGCRHRAASGSLRPRREDRWAQGEGAHRAHRSWENSSAVRSHLLRMSGSLWAEAWTWVRAAFCGPRCPQLPEAARHRAGRRLPGPTSHPLGVCGVSLAPAELPQKSVAI